MALGKTICYNIDIFCFFFSVAAFSAPLTVSTDLHEQEVSKHSLSDDEGPIKI